MNRRGRVSSGFTLLETLIVLVLMVLSMLLGIAMVQERLHVARVRVAAQQFAVHLRSARFSAVSTRSPVDVVIATDPVNTYQFTDVRGNTRTIELPPGVRIVSTTTPISFQSNGAVPGGASTVIETNLALSGLERWTIDTEDLGVPRMSYLRIPG